MRKKSWKQRIVSFFLTLVMLLTSLLTGKGVIVEAAPLRLNEVTRGTDITSLPGSSFDPATDQLITFKYNRSAGFRMYNVSGKMLPWIKNEHTVPEIRFQSIEELNGAKPSVVYYHVAQDKSTGNYYNLKVDIVGWERSAYTWKDPNGNRVAPFIGIATQKIGFYMLGLDHMDCRFTFLIDDGNGGDGRAMTSGEKKEFFSYATLCDLDVTQAFFIDQQPGLKGVYKIKGNDNIYQDGDLIVSKDKWKGGEITDSTPAGWVTAYMEGTDTFQISFHDEQKFANRFQAGDTPIRQLFNGIYPSSYHYGFSMQTVFSVPPMADMEIRKKVGEKGCSWDDAENADDPDIAHKINGYEEFDYLVQASVQTGYKDQTSYVVTDTLEDCLQIDDAAHVTIRDKNNRNVTGKFDITVNGQTITCSAKKEYLSDRDSDFYAEGQMFTIRIRAHRKKIHDVRNFMQSWLGEDGYTFYVPNTSILQYVSKAGGSQSFESNESWVTDSIGAVLAIEKDAKYDGWKVGDEVEYAVEVTQTKQDGYAVNVVITDRSIPDSLQLINGSWEVTGPNNGTAAAMSSDGENGWICTCPLLQHGESILIRFKCLATADSNGKDIINTAKAAAENIVDDEGGKIYVGDDAEVWINSPELAVDKTANAYEYQIGDRVKYTVVVRNTKDYTVAQNVVISDLSLPEGLQIAEDAGENGITVQFTPDSAANQTGWPQADGTTSINKMAKENTYAVERNGNGWTVRSDYLSSDAVMTITFDCIANKAINGIESQNLVSVTADNFVDEQGTPRTAQDDAEVYVNSAYFQIDKHIRNDIYEWNVGDHIPFEILVKNINDEGTTEISDDPLVGAAGKTVARNVLISDLDIPPGWKLDTESVEVEAVPQEVLPEELSQEETPQELPENPMDMMPEENPMQEDALPETQIPEDLPPEEDLILPEEIPFEVPEEIPYEELPVEGAESEMLQLMSFEEPIYGEPVYEEPFYEEPGMAPEEEWYPDASIPQEESWPEPDTSMLPEVMTENKWPGEAPSVEGIPESFADHVAGTADPSNQANPELYQETIEKPITWNLETIGNGWQLKISDLPAGHDVKIHFTCEALEAGNGQEGVNIGTVTAENAPEKSDDSEAYINTADLTIEKQMINRYAGGGEEDKQDGREPYEFRVGESVEYKVIVQNIQKNTIARNVVITDLSLPEGMVLQEDSILVEGIPSQCTNPVAGTEDPDSQLDPDHYKETETLPVNYAMEREGNGWKLTIDQLPCTTGDTLNQWNQPVVITYRCIPTEEVNGWEIINNVKVTADNAEEAKDSERIWINSPVLSVGKQADKETYLVGDTVTYTVHVIQEQTGCVARNVTISDAILTDGVKLQKNSIVLLDKDGTKFHIPDELIHVQGNSFTIHTGMHLIKEAGYINWDTENGGAVTKGEFNPLGITKESLLTVEYAVEIVDRDLAGQTIYNKVTVNSDENIPKDGEEEVPVEGAALDIIKESDKPQYLVGETGSYKLTVYELREGVTARDVVVRDAFEQTGMRILPESFRVLFNGEVLETAKVTLEDTGFVVETGKDMTVIDKLEIYYKVLFEAPSLDGQQVRNVATAKGSNTKEETQDNVVYILDENPSLLIEKTSDKAEYKVGEIGTYTVTVTQTEKGATARNVIIKDAIQIKAAHIVKDSIVIRNDHGRILDGAEIEYTDTYYSIYTGMDLEYKEHFTVTYEVKFAEESLAGQDILNVARATADNVKVVTREPEPVKISDGLTVYKSADPKTGSLVEEGSTIHYQIRVKNTSKEDKKNILIKDALPEYTEYVKDSAKGEDTAMAEVMELSGRPYVVFVLKSLPAGGEKTVEFAVTVKEAPQDAMLLNVAQVRETKAELQDMTEATWLHEDFRNTNETIHYLDTRWVDDSNTVHIDGGSLDIEKTSNKAHYAVGETGSYTLTVTQKKQGAVSKNVVVTDSLQKTGAVIVKDSIQVTKDGQTLKDAKVEHNDTEILVHTNTDLSHGQKIQVTYKVSFKKPSLAGTSVKNVASAKGDETPEGKEPKDENTVHVEKAGLVIIKASDKPVYRVGETAHYSLEVRNTSDTTAKNVVIKDVMKQQGAHVIAGTVKVMLDEKQIKKAEVKEIDNGFQILTHTDLSGGQMMKVTYDVTMEKASLSGRDIENVAVASSDNTESAEDTHHVTVNGPKPTGKPEKPEPTGKPEKPEEGTPTPQPSKGEPKLEVTKSVQPTQAKPGDTLQYTLNVRNVGTADAKQVVIQDSLNNNKAILQKDSIQASLEGRALKPKNLTAVSSGFKMETGQDLKKGQSIRVTYRVQLDPTIKSSSIRNVAAATSENGGRDETEVTVPIPNNGGGTTEPGNPVTNGKDPNGSLKGNVQTGDATPMLLIGMVGAAGVLGLLIFAIRKKKAGKNNPEKKK